MKKDVEYWCLFKGEKLKKLGYDLSFDLSDDTGEILIFKNTEIYMGTVYLTIDTMTGDFMHYAFKGHALSVVEEPMPVSLDLLSAILDLYSELGLANGIEYTANFEGEKQ